MNDVEYLAQVIRERDVERTMNRVLRADIERLRNALASISLAQYQSTSSASEKVHGIERELDNERVEVAHLSTLVECWQARSELMEEKRNEALAKIERLRNALAAISLAEYESTSSASEKVHGHARLARKALEETK